MAPTGRTILLLAVLATTGCTFVTEGAFNKKRAALDEDLDGSPWSEDCDDQDPARSPLVEETAYDGIDNDCDGQELLDKDRDGFPGISEEDYAALDPQVEYPPALVGKPVDCADDPDAVPNAALVYPDPSGAIEVLYDGVDGDCQGDNDFDADGDGYMPAVVRIDGVDVPTDDALDAYLETWGISPSDAGNWGPGGVGPALVGDCDDDDASVHPDNTVAEVFYDGIDRDCDGANDFDRDGDCFMPPGAEPLYAAYVTRYWGVGPVPFCVDAELPFGDCLDDVDEDVVAFPGGEIADPAAVHPATTANPNTDDPYDAIDADCAGDNDFDADGDGFMPNQVAGTDTLTLMNDYATIWGYDPADWVAGNPDAGLTSPVPGDCRDDRADAWPGALEVLGDGIDQDCDTGVDTTLFGYGDPGDDYDWTRPTNPEITRLGDRYLVLVGASAAYTPDYAQEVGIAFPFDLADARGAPAPSGPSNQNWKAANATLRIQTLLDIAMLPDPPDADSDGTPDPTVHTITNSDNIGTGYTYINVSGLRVLTNNDALLTIGGASDFVPVPYVVNGLDIVIDGEGKPFSLACADDRLHAVYSADLSPPHVNIGTAGGDTCFFQDAPYVVGLDWRADFSLCDVGGCDDWYVTEQPTFTNTGAAPELWSYGDLDEGWLSLVSPLGEAYVRDPSGAWPDTQAFPLDPVLHIDASVWDDRLFVAGIVDRAGTREVWLQWSTLGVDDAEVLQLPYDDLSVDGEVPQTVAIFADGDRVAVAVTATTGLPNQDSVAWVFLGTPP